MGDTVREMVANIELKKAAMEHTIKSLVGQFEVETGLHVATIRLDRFRRGTGPQQPPYRVEAVVQFWPKHTMEDLERDKLMRRLKRERVEND